MPTSKVQVTNARVHSQSSRVRDARVQSLATSAVQLSNIQVLAVPVQPVQLARHPVHRHSLQTVTVVADHRLLLQLVDVRPVTRPRG